METGRQDATKSATKNVSAGFDEAIEDVVAYRDTLEDWRSSILDALDSLKAALEARKSAEAHQESLFAFDALRKAHRAVDRALPGSDVGRQDACAWYRGEVVVRCADLVAGALDSAYMAAADLQTAKEHLEGEIRFVETVRRSAIRSKEIAVFEVRSEIEDELGVEDW